MTASYHHFSFEDRGAGVRKIRAACGWSQQELASAAGVSQAKISLFETGAQDLSAAAFSRVEDALVKARVAHGAELASADQFVGLELLALIHGNFGETATRSDATTKLIDAQDRLIILLRREIKKSMVKDGRITELEQRVADLRELYEAGTREALAHEKFEDMKEKLEAAE